jgi:hypothetical protein
MDAAAGGGGEPSPAPGVGGRKHLSSIANHVLRQCSLCVLSLILNPNQTLLMVDFSIV